MDETPSSAPLGSPAAPPQPGEQGKPKKTKVYIASALAFVVAYVVSNVITSYFLNKQTNDQAVQNVTSYFASTSTWKQFDSAVGHFQVLFPSYPGHETNSVPIPSTGITLTLDTYSSTDAKGTDYILNTSVYPDSVDTSVPENNLEGSLNGMLASTPGNKLVSSNISDFQGYKTLNFLIENDGSGSDTPIYLKGRVILVGHTMYQQMIEYQSKDYDDAAYGAFIQSFALTGA